MKKKEKKEKCSPKLFYLSIYFQLLLNNPKLSENLLFIRMIKFKLKPCLNKVIDIYVLMRISPNKKMEIGVAVFKMVQQGYRREMQTILTLSIAAVLTHG